MTAVVVVMTLRGMIRASTILLRLRLRVRLKLGEVRALPPLARKKRRMGHGFVVWIKLKTSGRMDLPPLQVLRSG
jgi:hypothetical protein